ncbi:MAG: valine--tRNA ligase [Bacteroidetes bacterium]|nr:MAG: valine--tRNA ligase [Bacteroidota bacterium]
MSETSTKYNPSATEEKWYQYWLDNKLFKSIPDEREPFTIVIPPPNVTGVLHMGHIMNNTIQDILIRRARMQGKNACWVPGTDHASIATEAKVVNKLAEEGIDKNAIGRDEFMKHAWEWTKKHGGIILEQLKKIGASCDWDRTKFTLDKDLSESVIKTFINLYNKGLIYRGIRMVNWDPKAKTAVSDEEVEYKDEQSKLYYVKYQIVDSNEFVTIATTRPETIIGDTAVCVHPEDERYKHLKGKKVIIPLVNREVPVIFDDYIDIEFGTGALKVTPAHDENDYKLGQKHNLQVIDIFNEDGTISKEAGIYEGMDRFELRKSIIDDLEKSGNLVKIEDYTNRVGYSQRTQVPIEPKLSMQWFLKMEELVKPAIENVNNGNIKFSPKRFVNTYNHWLENVRDWNISRQLWWGHQIPAYYIAGTNEYVIADNIENALKLAKEKTHNSNLTINDLKQDEDVLDTWFSSWLWPISVFDGIRNPDNEEINYYYPTNVLATGHDIIFFWVARMIFAGYEFRNERPFKDVYFTGMVRDEKRRKMSKQLGNSPDPIKLIEKYGADGVRFGMMLCSPAGGDLLYNDSLPEQGRNFSNKIWNSYRLIKSWEIDETIEQPEHSELALNWFKNKFHEQIKDLDKQYDTFKLSEALMTVYRLFKDEFSSWLLEIIKPDYQKPIDSKSYNKLIHIFDELLRVLHPFMPFITEELWQHIKDRKNGKSIMITEMPKPSSFDTEIIADFEITKDIITQIRNIRKEKSIPFKTKLKLFYKNDNQSYNKTFESIINRLSGIETITKVQEKPENVSQFIVKKTEYFIPLGELIDKDAEIKKLTEELNYTKGFLNSVMKKLGNERFVNNAPAPVIEKEKIKQADAEAKIKALEEQIKNLKKQKNSDE